MCRKCPECRKLWKAEWIGRLLAEEHGALAVWFVTLTYGGGYDRAAAYVLDREDIRPLMSKLRHQGHAVRQVVVGEYGGKHGRGHWHGIFFWYSEPPEVDFDRRIEWTYKTKRGHVRPYWPHGLVQIEKPRSKQAAVGYLLGYLDKDPTGRGEFSFSKRPAIGEPYLLGLAEERARQGKMLFPKGTPTYQVPGNVKDRGAAAGQLYDYWLSTRSAIYERMLMTYVTTWLEHQPGRLVPPCKHVTAWLEDLDGLARRGVLPDRISQNVSLIERSISRWGFASRLEFHSCEIEDLVLVVAPGTGAAEFREYDERTGEITWRFSVDLRVGADGQLDRAEIKRICESNHDPRQRRHQSGRSQPSGRHRQSGSRPQRKQTGVGKTQWR